MKKGTMILLLMAIAMSAASIPASAQDIESAARNILNIATPTPMTTIFIPPTPTAATTPTPQARPTSPPAPKATAAATQASDATSAPMPTLALPQGQPTPVPMAPMPETLYVGIAQTNVTIRETMDREAASVGYYREGDRVQIIAYEPEWLVVVKGSAEDWVTGYVLRHTVSQINTQKMGELPYGNTPAAYSATISKDTMLYTAPNTDSSTLLRLTEGTKVAILEIKDGWAKVIYWRQYGYFYMDAVDELTPVYDIATAQSGDTIAAFISFYNLSQEGLNPNRMINIAKACEYISIPMEPGFEFSFNGIAGPYQYRRGYLDGMSFFEGQAVPSVGGGTCQVSSTLYNVLLPLEGGITVVYRRAHGPSGATYLPHGVDAAVGNKTLDLVFRNDYGFTVRIEASSQDGVLYIAMLKA